MLIWSLKTLIHLLVGVCLISLPVRLASANMEHRTPHWTSSTVFFESANACLWAGVATQICQAGHRSAFRQHVRVAPGYRELVDCEADFSPGECFASDGSGHWSPWLAGFALITHAQLSFSGDDSRSELEPQTQRWGRPPMWLVHASRQTSVPDTRVRYFSEPLYWESDHQGGKRLTSLREKLRNGERFDKAMTPRQSAVVGSVTSSRRLARTFEPQRLLLPMGTRIAPGVIPLAF